MSYLVYADPSPLVVQSTVGLDHFRLREKLVEDLIVEVVSAPIACVCLFDSNQTSCTEQFFQPEVLLLQHLDCFTHYFVVRCNLRNFPVEIQEVLAPLRGVDSLLTPILLYRTQ